MGSVIPVDPKDKVSRRKEGEDMTEPSTLVESSLTATVHLLSALSRCIRTKLHLPVEGKVKREIGTCLRGWCVVGLAATSKGLPDWEISLTFQSTRRCTVDGVT